MSRIQDGGVPRGNAVGEAGTGRAIDAARWLHYAAAPTFMAMALLTAALGQGATAMLSATSAGMPAMHGMVLMYLLMALFHAGPWVTLATRHLGIGHGRADREQDNVGHWRCHP